MMVLNKDTRCLTYLVSFKIGNDTVYIEYYYEQAVLVWTEEQFKDQFLICS